MKTRSIILMTAVAALTVTGCVSKKKYEALSSDYNSLQSQYNTTQLALTECQTGGKSLQAMLADAKKGNEDLQRNYAELQNALNQSIANNSQGNVNISKLVDEINASNKYIKQLIEAKSKSDSLNMVLTNNLTRSLSSSELQD
ncbi:MAG: hypothetical protein K2J66_02885, partial [Muribaculaceae bacterium]|nr:hypothetical protein [Muribaculaceae bacterium]